MNPARPTARSLTQSLVWATSGRLAAQAISWIVTLWVVRLLTPADYGLMVMAMVVVAGLRLFEEVGFGPVLVQAPNLDAITTRKIFGLIIFVAILLAAALVLVAPLVAQFFGHSELVPLLYVLALLFLASPSIIVPRSLLERRLAFKRIAFADVVSALLGSLATLVLALYGAKVWALVLGTVLAAFVRAVALSFASPPLGMPIFSLRGLGGSLHFGGRILAERIIWFVYTQADLVIAGKLLGSHDAGVYVMGKELAALPAEKLLPGLQQVALPAFSRMHDHGGIGDSLARGLGIASFVTFPICFGLVAIAPDFIPIVLGPHWEPAIISLRSYALVVPIGVASGLTSSALKATGRADESLKNVALGAVIMLSAFAIGSAWGLAGLSLSWVIGYPIYFAASLTRAAAVLGIRAGKLVAGMGGPLAASVLMWLLVVGMREVLTGLIPPILRLALLVIFGVCVYALVALATQRRRLLEILELVRPEKVLS